MMFLDLANFYLIPGIVMGSIYAIGAIGITLVFSIMRHTNLAHGDMATFGAFSALALFSAIGISPYLVLPLATVIVGFLSIVIDWIFYEHLRNKPKILTTISSLGVGLMLRSVVQIIWGVNTTAYVTGINKPYKILGLKVKSTEIITLGVSAALVIILILFLNRNRWGKAMRAMSNSPDLALISGIDNRKVVALTWFVVGVLCCCAGFFLGINTELKSMMGWNILLPTIAAAILGGIGRIEGALVGGLIIGLIEEMSLMVIPAEYKAASSFVVLLLVLLLRPTGFFRSKII
ncbi:MAG: branched-chain amino acid ABC transporter permease [Rhodobacteraceae bacterium]|nr:branched-chain amino acid ABC transporter permease [Paracoccaceae bacterium]